MYIFAPLGTINAVICIFCNSITSNRIDWIAMEKNSEMSPRSFESAFLGDMSNVRWMSTQETN